MKCAKIHGGRSPEPVNVMYPFRFSSKTYDHDFVTKLRRMENWFYVLEKTIVTKKQRKNEFCFALTAVVYSREITPALKENELSSRDCSGPPLCDSRTRLRLIFGIVSWSVGGAACLFVRNSSKSSEGNVGLWMIGVWDGRERQRYGWERYRQPMSRIFQKTMF